MSAKFYKNLKDTTRKLYSNFGKILRKPRGSFRHNFDKTERKFWKNYGKILAELGGEGGGFLENLGKL